jgi:hypothetical protein
MDELRAGIEFSLAVFPEPSVLLQPGKATLDDPAFGQDLEGVPFVSFGDLYRDMLIQDRAYTLGERFTLAAIAERGIALDNEYALLERAMDPAESTSQSLSAIWATLHNRIDQRLMQFLGQRSGARPVTGASLRRIRRGVFLRFPDSHIKPIGTRHERFIRFFSGGIAACIPASFAF